MSNNNHVGKWNACLDIIRDNVPEQTYKTWFCPIVPLKFEDNTLYLQVPSQFFYEFLEEKFLDLLRQTIHKVFGEGAKLMYSVMVVKNPPTAVPLPPHAGASSSTLSAQRKVVTKDIPQTPQIAELDPHLNRDYNFDTFIEGESNKLSRSVAEAVALNPAKTIFNPLFFYGASGVGKTHLANAIGTKIKELYPEKRVLYVSAHLFQVQYTDSVRKNKFNDFINFYQSVEVLIIDDIQEISGESKQKTQQAFFHIFNHLQQTRHQLIMTSDRPPIQLEGMEERLLTRFKWGLVAELEKPDTKLAKKILLDKIHRNGLKFPREVVDYIAENATENIRDLEGVINAMLAYSVVYNSDIDLELAQRVVARTVKLEQKPITINEIVEHVSEYYDIPVKDICSKSRKQFIAQARQVSMYLAQKHTGLSYSRIGSVIGKRDHSTVLHSCNVIEHRISTDKVFRREMENIEASFR